ncbi:hypothetical protein G7Z17_g4152 [Cylindrodendrum hubeiense]|uniref:Uncharacterized protein n=1 Tax=Cylindrodendrum hubeiense TaxID=595255 RepID=A0A9P5H9D9_9HYPO|nr:hypothetical protein G7Z17_g4152 [Cylindrodendrum hubeiense]
MSANLAKALGKSIVESKNNPKTRDQIRMEAFSAAAKRIQMGDLPTLPNYPIVIGDGTAIASPQHLQEIIGKPFMPEGIQTTTDSLVENGGWAYSFIRRSEKVLTQSAVDKAINRI